MDAGDALESCLSCAAREDWQGAVTAFRAVPVAGADPAAWCAAAAAVQDWAAVLRAEAAWDTGRPLPLPVAKTMMSARLELGLFEEARDAAIAGRARFPNAIVFARGEINARLALGDEAGAASLAHSIASQRAGAGIGLMAPILLSTEGPAACIAYLDSAEEDAGAKTLPLILRWRLTALLASGCPAEALACAERRLAIAPGAESEILLARCILTARDAAASEVQAARVEAWRSDPTRRPDWLRAAPSVLRAHFQCFLRWDDLADAVSDLRAQVLAIPGAREFIAMVSFAGQRAAARDMAERIAAWFPSVPGAWRLHLSALTLDLNKSALSAARASMRAALPPRAFRATLAAADPRSWLPEDVPELIADHLGGSPRSAAFFARLGRMPLSEPQLQALDAGGAARAPGIALQSALIAAQARDRSALDHASLRPESFASFIERREEAVARIGARVTEAASALSGVRLPAAAARHLTGLAGTARARGLFSAECYADAVAIAECLASHARRGAALSALRLGDGEGVFLPAHPAVAAHAQRDEDEIQSVWWGEARMTGGVRDRILAEFARAVRRATMVGLPPLRTPGTTMLQDRPETRYDRGIFNAVLQGSAMAPPEARIVSAHFPHDLANWSLWPDVLGAAPSVSYISCHDLRSFLHLHFGAAVREGLHIPAEHQFRQTLGKHPDGGTLLDRHDNICAAIAPRPGEIWLVAAGFLGKIYCDLVCARGGLGIDIGSLADFWSGVSSRANRILHPVQAGTPTLLIPDHPLRAYDAPASSSAPTGMASAATFRARIPASALPAPHQAARPLKIIGHPRCASGYMARAFSEQGLPVGHERLLPGGICSWMHAVRDRAIPWGDNATENVEFDAVIAHVRDPADALASIILENGIDRSFSFRRLHIHRTHGLDIAAYESALDRAAASFLFWYDIALEQARDGVLRAEDGAGAIRMFLNQTRLRPAPEQAGDIVRHGHAAADEDESTFNSSSRRFRLPKPTIAAADYESLDPVLRERLAEFCARFGYDLPWAADGPAHAMHAS